MKGIRQAVTGLCLATTLSALATSPAASAEPARAAQPGTTPIVRPEAKLDLSQLRMTGWSLQTMASPRAPLPLKIQMQTSQSGTSGMSTAKKTWIIVGSVLGAGLVIAAVSNHGGSGGGGGGY